MAGGGGVRGRPQACVTCFRRKKGCDLQRPSCGQCRKACIPCGGYTRTRTGAAAVQRPGEHTGPSSSQQPQKPGPLPLLSSQTGPYSSIASSEAYSVRPNFSSLPQADAGANASVSVVAGPLPPPPPLPMVSAIEVQTLDTYQHCSPPENERIRTPSRDPEVLSYQHEYRPLRPKAPAHGSDDLPGVPSQPLDQSYLYRYYSTESSSGGRPSFSSPFSRSPSSNTTSGTPGDSWVQHPAGLPDHDRYNRQHYYRDRRQQREGSADLAISAPLARSAHESRLIGRFWEAFLPNSKPFPEITASTLGGSASAASDLSSHGGIIRKALLATALTTLGKESGAEPWLVKDAYRLYGEAISELSDALKSRRRWDIDLVVATRQFALYEALHGNDARVAASPGNSWVVHSFGDVAILTSKPPSAYTRGLAHRLFVAGRHSLFLSAMLARKRTFLSEPEWKTVPWSEIEKNPRDYLLDILVDVPSILEGISALSKCEQPQQREKNRKLLRKAMQGITTRLLEWNAKYEVPIIPESVTSELPATVSAEELAAAHVMSLYWASCIRMFNIHRKLLGPGERPEHRLSPDQLCKDLVRAIRLFLHPSVGLFRQNITPFPMSTAIEHIRSVDRHKMAIERKILFESLARPECRLIRDFMMSLDRKDR